MVNKVKFDPLCGKLETVPDSVSTSEGVVKEFECTSGNVGDVVHHSATTDNKVEASTNNTDDQRSIGVIIEKNGTTAKVKILGYVSGFSGLTRGAEVFLSTSGTLTSTPPTTGYVQIMGYATSTTEVCLEPGNFRAKRYPF